MLVYWKLGPHPPLMRVKRKIQIGWRSKIFRQCMLHLVALLRQPRLFHARQTWHSANMLNSLTANKNVSGTPVNSKFWKRINKSNVSKHLGVHFLRAANKTTRKKKTWHKQTKLKARQGKATQGNPSQAKHITQTRSTHLTGHQEV